MKPIFANFGSRSSAGRPPVAELSEHHLDTIRAHYLATNRNRKEGSILLAWVRFCEDTPGFSHLVADHMPATSIPTIVVDACRKAKALVGAHRGGERRLRHEGPYVPGTMRRHRDGDRRLLAGERASVDDATRNVACYIPWPWGGCPCSEKFGVRLGRWQTLIVHDDATGFVPIVSSVFRWSQSYRATDAVGVIFKAERDVLRWDCWSIEGGVWQAARTLEVLAGRFHSAKGRPNQKLVENYIGRLWNIMAGQPGDVGRHQAELKRSSELYVAARAGRVDPRQHFMSLDVAQAALYASIDYLSEKRMDSRTYGSWVPKARWEADLAAHPRAARADETDHLILPIAATRKVRSGMIRMTAEGPLGVPMIWTFAADWLWQFEGRELRFYFDPLAAWPVEATLTLPDRREAIGKAVCISPLDASKDRAAEMAKAIRQTMMTEVRVLSAIHKKKTEREVRHPGGTIIASRPDVPETVAPNPRALPVGAEELPRRVAIDTAPGPFSERLREASAPPPQTTRDDLANSLSRRLSKIKELQS